MLLIIAGLSFNETVRNRKQITNDVLGDNRYYFIVLVIGGELVVNEKYHKHVTYESTDGVVDTIYNPCKLRDTSGGPVVYVLLEMFIKLFKTISSAVSSSAEKTNVWPERYFLTPGVSCAKWVVSGTTKRGFLFFLGFVDSGNVYE